MVIDALPRKFEQAVLLLPGLIGYWQLSECSGLVALDSSPYKRNGAHVGVTLCRPGWGGRAAAFYDGANDYTSILSAGLAAAFNGSLGSLLLVCQVAGSGVWADGASRIVAALSVDANNFVRMIKRTGANQFGYDYRAGGTLETITRASSETTFFLAALTWNKAADRVRAYFNRELVATATTLGVWAGTITSGFVGAADPVPNSVFHGDLQHVALFDQELTQQHIRYLYGRVA